MNKKTIVGVAAATLAIFAVAWAAAPIVAAQSLIRAAKAGDAARLEQLVDFPSLRDSLKVELEAEVLARVRSDPRLAESGLGGIGMMLAPMLLAGAVDTVVTPQVVAAMVRDGEAPDPTDAPDPAPKAGDAGDDIHQSWGYRDLNTFAVTLTRRDAPNKRLALLMDRRGLFSWKLAAVDLQSVPEA